MMSQPKHILVVDDDGDVRDVIVAILEENNFRVSSAASGSLMRDFLQTADPVECVVLDALMPGEASISFVLHLKKVGLPVVVISGSPDAMEHAAENNLQLLRQPFHAQELYDAVNTALSSGEFGPGRLIDTWKERRDAPRVDKEVTQRTQWRRACYGGASA
jgi:two-component system OmpR family response regulator